ncbi:hypothetical protein DFQ01_101326 [Paenibacillus cellulosilyticus]|uniref:Uncharacterized protein n=1 Tax=Paenibacillus cellulosilyticus TaxID=375489 RepID=A0A2V2YZZ9_9BACL|nr:hypothetical protein [Paenibacillus cellulosilyticus]PWW08603.1 hypothetical protein DFQ01_101326 [Paenibacillus cellulosilyticus]QKS48172.1 hypothetical protein HUB94_28250 [Paenibacillus cellulosilyticus]
MSLSINSSSYSRHYLTQSTSSQASTQTDTTYEASSAQRRELERPKPEESTGAFQLSPEMLRYLAGIDNENDEATDTDTTYSASINSSMLTTDQKKSMLSDLQTDLGTLDSSTDSSDSPSGLEELLATIQDELADFDASNASDEEVSALFDEVMGTLDQARPPLPPPPPDDESESGVPPMLQAMGGITPPFMLGVTETDEAEGTQESTDNSLTLTTEQKKDWLSQLQTSLQALSEEVSESSDSGDPLEELRKLLQSKLNGFNAESTSDSEVSTLFSSIAEIL